MFFNYRGNTVQFFSCFTSLYRYDVKNKHQQASTKCLGKATNSYLISGDIVGEDNYHTGIEHDPASFIDIRVEVIWRWGRMSGGRWARSLRC